MEQQAQRQFGYQTVQLIKTEQLGKGSYGAVYKAMYDDLPCAGKILHPTLFQFNDLGEKHAMERFQQECSFLSAIRHPNIIQYLGVHNDPDTNLPVLLMELMEDEYQVCSSRVLQLSNSAEILPRELLQKGSRKRRPKTHYFSRLSKVPTFYANRT